MVPTTYLYTIKGNLNFGRTLGHQLNRPWIFQHQAINGAFTRNWERTSLSRITVDLARDRYIVNELRMAISEFHGLPSDLLIPHAIY